MNIYSLPRLHVVWLTCFLGLTLTTSDVRGEGLVVREVEHGTIYGYKDTPILPWTKGQYHIHDPDRPVPKYVAPGQLATEMVSATRPSDAIVLTGGNSLRQWKPSSWKVADGSVEAGEGNLETKDAFGDFQLHIEWMTPISAPATSSEERMNRGNSGVMLMGRYEIQIFDSYHEHSDHIYPDGQAAAIYGQFPPLVNACRAPGQWQSFDILFTAPIFQDGQLRKRAVVTMLHNGVLVHLNREVMGQVAHREIAVYQAHPPKLPLVLQGHHSPVRFRNIWIRPLANH